MSELRIVLVDDHTLFRDSLKSMLESNGLAEVVGVSGDADEVLELVAETHPDVVLMDYRLGASSDDGIVVTRKLRRSFPNIPVIMLTMYEDRDLVVAAAKAGVAGFILKDSHSDDFNRALQVVAAGDAWLSPRIAKQVLVEVMTYSSDQDEGAVAIQRYGLTQRELEVLGLIVRGATYAEMARALLVSVSEIKHLMGSILQKLEASDKAHAAAIAVGQKIVPPPR